MEYEYKETVDWGIIKREWISDQPDCIIVLEKHEEDRFTVAITYKELDLEYYSYWVKSGKLTFSDLEEAKTFASSKLAAIRQGDYSGCAGTFAKRP